ncbi:hypothetical protein Sjap_022872 [Stephania japonica]|uniref:Fe2OG dioxygenase domain-containing protein n=1 Tax=Stephania japonica TaxID=461633 RepID=A0AAP0EPN5_9MAGN
MTWVKSLVESTTLTSIPSCYAYSTHPSHGGDATSTELVDEHQRLIPTIDFSLLVSTSTQQRSLCVQQLGDACREWGFFYVTNHGIPQKVIEGILEACSSFFNLSEEEKKEFEGTHVMDPIRCGSSFNSSVENVLCWRDFLKVSVHPEFHFPYKPASFSDISLDYCRRVRGVALELVGGISESLGLEKDYMKKALEMESGLNSFIANFYPPCPQPKLAIGLPPHSDRGVLTLLVENQPGGLEIKHNGRWIQPCAPPNSFLVNVADHLEILSNGKYKSVVHRVVVNNKTARISLAIAHGPSANNVVVPAPELLLKNNQLAAYRGMTYEEYFMLQQSNQLNGKSCLDRVRIGSAF